MPALRSNPSKLQVALSSAPRLRAIVTVLTRHGLADLLSAIELPTWLRSGDQTPSSDTSTDVSSAAHLRQALEELGGTFIKLGQLLSTRTDLLPTEWTEELRKLQKDCPKLSLDEVEQALVQAYGNRLESLFSEIDHQPLAAGSIAQIQGAVLACGTPVVLKILRPGLAAQLQADLEVLGVLASFAERKADTLGFSPSELTRELSRELLREVDLLHEGRSTDRLRRAFEDDARVVFPRVFWNETTPTVLVLERIEGRTLSQVEPEELPLDARRAIVAAGVDAVFRQCLELGLFHSDPHPGNLIYQDDGRLAFVDCGQTGHIDRQTAERLTDLLAGILRNESEQVTKAAVRLTDADPALLSDRNFKRRIEELMIDLDVDRLDRFDVGRVLQQFFSMLREFKIRCPGDLLLLIKALSTIEAVGDTLDPTFDIARHVTPHVERLLAKRFGPTSLLRKAESALRSFLGLVEELPAALQVLAGPARHEGVGVHLRHRGLEPISSTIEHASRNIAFALLISATVVGSSILLLADRLGETPGALSRVSVGGFVVAAVLSLVLARSHYQTREDR